MAATSRLALVAEDEAGLALFGATGNSSDDDDDVYTRTGIARPATETADPLLMLSDLLASAAATPGAPGAAFVLAVPPTAENSAFTLRWNSEAGKTYTIYRSTDLIAGFRIFKDNISATPPLNLETDAMTNGTAFYVIGVR